MNIKSVLSVLLIVVFLVFSGCSTQSKNLEISKVQLTPGKEILGGFSKTPTGQYYQSTLSFIITNKGAKTDPGHYSISARVYDKNGNFVSKPFGWYGSSLEPGESNSVNLYFTNINPKDNLNFAAIKIGKIDIILHYITEDGKSSYDDIYTFNY
jgi:hypothetical protein